MSNVRLPSMLVRITWLVNILLGIGLWTGKFDAVKEVHITFGVAMVIALWWITALHVRSQGWGALPILAILDGLALYLLGITQESLLTTGPHWIVQVLHLALALVAIALSEIMTARITRAASSRVA